MYFDRNHILGATARDLFVTRVYLKNHQDAGYNYYKLIAVILMLLIK